MFAICLYLEANGSKIINVLTAPDQCQFTWCQMSKFE